MHVLSSTALWLNPHLSHHRTLKLSHGFFSMVTNTSSFLNQTAFPPCSPFHWSFSLFLRDVLPFTLKLPEAIASARTFSDLEEVAKLGAGLFAYLYVECINGQVGELKLQREINITFFGYM